jgi:hypothetical protein
MKKGFLVFLAILALNFFAVPSHALLGVDDNVPGYDVLVPYFLLSMPGHGNINTLIAITETCESSVTFHYYVYNKNGGVSIYDDFLSLTQCDIATTDANTIISMMSAANRATLEVDLDGDGTNDHYVGYVVFEHGNTEVPKNQVTATAYFVDLPKGISTGMNLPVREVDEGLSITDSKLINPTRHTEYFSANALFHAQQYIGLQGSSGTVSDAGFFRLLPRYYIMDSGSINYFIIWSSTGFTDPLPVNLYDNEEHVESTNLPPLNAGLNIFDIGPYIPTGLYPPTTYPKEGWVDIRISTGSTDFNGDREMLGYSSAQFQATGPAGVCGDTNGNGVVDIGDAMYIAQYLVENRASLSCVSSSNLYFLSVTEMHKDVGP